MRRDNNHPARYHRLVADGLVQARSLLGGAVRLAIRAGLTNVLSGQDFVGEPPLDSAGVWGFMIAVAAYAICRRADAARDRRRNIGRDPDL